MNLFCFPFAGANKYSYNQFIPHLAKGITINTLELPGRGRRIKEPAFTDIHEMAEDLYQLIQKNLFRPYAFYGHSMGTILAYLVIKKIIRDNLPLPVYLFVSGRGGPAAPDKERKRYQLPREEFIAELRDMGGSPDEVLNDDGLMDFFEPILRADFTAIERYSYEETSPFPVPILAMAGLEEKITMDELAAWQKETSRKAEFKKFTGKHFFIYEHAPELVHLINTRITNYRI
jgi:surfactin synthase thioesterase subunit